VAPLAVFFAGARRAAAFFFFAVVVDDDDVDRLVLVVARAAAFLVAADFFAAFRAGAAVRDAADARGADRPAPAVFFAAPRVALAFLAAGRAEAAAFFFLAAGRTVAEVLRGAERCGPDAFDERLDAAEPRPDGRRAPRPLVAGPSSSSWEEETSSTSGAERRDAEDADDERRAVAGTGCSDAVGRRRRPGST
jgi:hypothetical protein